jgi:hypothetical protein
VKDLLKAKSDQELFALLARMPYHPPMQVRVLVVGSERPIQQLAAHKSPFPLRLHEGHGFSVGDFSYHAGDLRLSGEMFFCPSPVQKISYIVSICSSTVWQRSILRFAHALYPELVTVFFSQQELIRLLRQAEKIVPNARLQVVSYSQRRGLRTGRRRTYESSRTHTDRSLEAVLSEIEEQNSWFRSVTFEYLPAAGRENYAEGMFGSATLSKYGSLFCSAHFDRFLYGTLKEMSTIAEKKMEFFSNRSRRFAPSFGARPISISYETPEFNSSVDTKSFVRIVRKMPGVSCAVLHDNPYVHMSIVDSVDGSAADLWVLKNDEILLVPQLKASEAALKKFVNYIFEEWREGSVSSPTSADAL